MKTSLLSLSTGGWMRRVAGLLGGLGFAAPAIGFAAAAPAAAEVQFMRDIAPILVGRCISCHGAIKDEGDLRLHTFERLIEGEHASVVPGHPELSSLFERITLTDGSDRMPKEDDPLSAAQIELVRRWIQAGAKFDGADAKVPFKSMFGPRQHPAAPAAYPVPIPVAALALAPNGREIAVGGYHEVIIRDATSGELLRRLGHLPQKIQTLAYTRDGTRLIVGGGTPGDYGELALVDAESGVRVRVLDTFADVVLAASLRDDGQRVAAAAADQTVRVYDMADGRRLWNMKLHADWATSVAFSPDQKYVASASKDKTVKIYEAETGLLYTTYTGHNKMIGKYAGQHPIYAVRFVPGSPVALSAGGGAWIQLWEPDKAYAENGTAADMEDRFKTVAHTRYIEHGATEEVFALAVGEGRIFASTADGMVKQFDLEKLTEVRAYPGHEDWVYALDYSGAANRLVTGDYQGYVRVWDVATGACLVTFQATPLQAKAVPSLVKAGGN